MFKPRPSRLKGFDYRGEHRYSLRFTVFRRQCFFENASMVALVWGQILRAAHEERFAVTAYCFMPDHVHLVVAGMDPGADLKVFFVNAKRFTAVRFHEQFDARLWERGGFERVLRRDEHTERVVRYVLENPVRAGLVSHPRQYPFLGSAVCGIDELLEWAYRERTR